MTTTVSDSGGFQDRSRLLPLETTTGSIITYTYEHFPVPDRFTIYYDGNVIYDSGFVSNSGTVTIDVPAGEANEVEIVLDANNSVETTEWNYTATAEPNPLEPPTVAYEGNSENFTFTSEGNFGLLNSIASQPFVIHDSLGGDFDASDPFTFETDRPGLVIFTSSLDGHPDNTNTSSVFS